MTIMKKSTTCGRREMRALYEARQTNVAPAHPCYTDKDGAPIPGAHCRRPQRDHGNAPWNKHLAPASLSLPRRMRRALSGVRKLSGMESLVTMEKILRVKGGR